MRSGSNATGGGTTKVAGNGRGGKTVPTMNVGDTGDLLALLDRTTAGSNGKVALPSRTGPSGSVNGVSPSGRMRAGHVMLENRTTNSPGGRRPLP